MFNSSLAPNAPMELKVFLTADNITNATLSSFEDTPPTWHLSDLRFLSWDGPAEGLREFSVTIPVPQAVQDNATWYVHAFVISSDESGNAGPTLHTTKAITRYLPLSRDPAARNLMGWSGLENETRPDPATIRASLHPNVSLGMLYVPQLQVLGLPQELSSKFSINTTTRTFDPILFVNDFWKYRADYTPLNTTTPTAAIHFQFQPLTLFKWQLYVQMEQSFAMQVSMGAARDGDEDEFKRMFVETNPVLLALTVVVTLLHTVFDCLAFKNDISFWRSRKNMTGVSVRSMLLSLGCQVIVLLYLLDKDTSWLILSSSAVGLVIDVWKLKKAVAISVSWNGARPQLSWKPSEDYVSTTKQYDEMAFKYLGFALLPLLTGYSVYSLLYHEHRGWYSFVIGVLAGAVYTFGFIMMTPQLFINYKLKSVAHLPWRMLTYKALNTFIDDLFAFIIKMPTLHRLACFRDDVVFFIYLYQRYCYPVDKTRTNEFTDETAPADGPDSNAPALPAPSTEEKKGEFSDGKKKEESNVLDQADGNDDDQETQGAAEAALVSVEEKKNQ